MATVDYTMARRAVLRNLDRGLLSRYEVCDAHPDLLRAAKYAGEPAREFCPVCERDDLRFVLYAYGNELKRGNGYVRRREDVRALHERLDEFRCYIVEVCTHCSWNHLVRSFLAGRRHATAVGA